MDDRQQALCKAVCDDYIQSRGGANRKRLVIEFGPQSISQLISQNIIETSSDGNRLMAKLATFAVADDPALLDYAKVRMAVVIRAMKDVYVSDDLRNQLYPWERLSAAAQQHGRLTEDDLRVGICFVREAGLNAGYQQDGEGSVRAFGIPDTILEVRDVEGWIDERLNSLRPRAPIVGQAMHAFDPSVFGAEDLAPFSTGPAGVGRASSDFSFMTNESLRAVVERDYEELSVLHPGRNPKSVLIMAGAIIEGVLLDALVRLRKKSFETIEAASGRSLNDMIGPARAAGIITEDRLADAVRKYRALAHPARESRDNIEYSVHDAQLAKAAVEVILREVRRWHRESERSK